MTTFFNKIAKKREEPIALTLGRSQSLEKALTPVVCALIGFGIDTVAGTIPIFTVLLLFMSIAAMFIKSWYSYGTEMAEHTDALPREADAIEADVAK